MLRLVSVIRVVSIILILLCVQTCPLMAQKKTKSPSSAAGQAVNPNPAPGQKQSAATPVASPPSQVVLGDYVPCLFDQEQNAEFRALGSVPKTVTAVQSQAAWQNVNSALGGKLKLSAPELEGQTYADATAMLQNAITSSGASSAQQIQANQAAANAFTDAKAPTDVSCSINLMQYKETKDVFGHRVADRFVALQVNVRNLNANSEFLIHDIQAVVDTGVDPKYFGRFQSSRDKLIVRAVAQIGQTDDSRNRWLNFLTMLGSVAGGANAELQVAEANTSAAANFSTAVAIFQGAVLTGLANIFPDHTVDYLNHINDLSFSASSTSKTIVPTKGSVPLVTFIAERPLEQLPFAYCGHKTIPHSTVELAKYSAYCQKMQGSGSADGNATQPVDYVPPLTYSNWNAAALRILEANTYVVLGGVHITENPASPSLHSLNCPPFEDGTVNLSVATNGSLACIVNGSSLNKATGVALEQGSNKVTGSIQSSQDGSSATLLFTASQLAPLTGAYTLDWTSPTGPDVATGASLSFSPRSPNGITIQATNPAGPLPKSVSVGTALVVTLQGNNLDQLASLSLTCSGSTKSATLGPINILKTNGNSVSGSMNATFAATDLATLGAGACTFTGQDTQNKAVTMPTPGITLTTP